MRVLALCALWLKTNYWLFAWLSAAAARGCSAFFSYMASTAAYQADGSADVPETARFAKIVEKFASAFTVLTTHDAETVAKLQVVGKHFMMQSAQESCRRAGDRPLLTVYGSDLAPMLHKMRSAAHVGGKKEKRESNQPCEWCLHRAYFVWRDD